MSTKGSAPCGSQPVGPSSLKTALDRAMALSVGATAFNLGGVWGAYKQRLMPTAVCTVGQVVLLLAYWREMAIYYERHRDE